MKKIFAVILAIAIISSSIAMIAVADDAALLGGEVADAEPGTTVGLPVSIQNNPGTMYLSINLEYDHEALELVIPDEEAEDYDDLVDQMFDGVQAGFAASEISFADNGSRFSFLKNRNSTKSGLLVTLLFKVNANANPGTYTIGISQNEAYNKDEQDVNFAAGSGSITVPNPPAEAPKMNLVNVDNFSLEDGKIITWGWAGANYEAKNLGYRIDGGEVELDDVSFANFNTPDEETIIKNAAGEYAFRFTTVGRDLDVSALSEGDHTLTVVVQVQGPEGRVLLDMYTRTFTISSVAQPAELVAKSFNTVYCDGALICDTGDAAGYIAEHPIVGDLHAVSARGWAWIRNSNIDAFGYQIDEEAVVYSTDYTQPRPEILPILGAPSNDVCNGFNIVPIDVSALGNGEHTIKIWVKAVDGVELKVDEYMITIERPVVYELKNVSYDGIYHDGAAVILPEGSMDKKVKDPANREKLDYVEGAVSTISFRGWVRISENEADIAAYGYSIDGADPVYDGSFFENRGTQLADAGFPGAVAFNVAVPVTGLGAGDHTIDIYVKAVDGTEFKVVKDRSTEQEQILNQVGVTFTITSAVVAPEAAIIKCNVDSWAFDGSALSTHGWAGANYPATALGYRVDGGEAVFASLNFTDMAPAEVDIIKSLAGEYAFRFAGSIALPGLTVGEHAVELLVKVDDGKDTVLTLHRGTITVKGADEEPDPAVLHAQSFNTVWVDGTMICDVGDALAFLNENPIKGDHSSIGVRGWAWIDNSNIESFGYRIDDGEPVFDAAFTQARPEILGVLGAPSNDVCNGYQIVPVDVSALAEGAHTITVLIKAADGNIVEVVTAPFEIDRPAVLHAQSFNTVWVDGTMICDVGDALAFLNENPIKGDHSSIGVRGWAWIDNGNIESFGYRIDNGEPVFDAAFTQARPEILPVLNAPSNDVCNGYWIQSVDISELADGAHTITVLVKADDGTVVEVVTAPFEIERAGAQEPYSIQNVSYDELKYDATTLFSESVYKKLANLEDKSILDFEEGAVKVITVRGWANVSDSPADITGYGYSIDGGEIVTGSFVQDRPDLAGAGFPGGVGFNVEVPVEELKAGEHTITVYLFAEDGSQIQLIKVKEGVEYPIGVTFNVIGTPDEPAPTSDIAIVAIAAVGCIAAAGVVIVKKKFSK